MQNLKIVVLRGGKSPEREVSLVSGAEISQQLALNGHHVIQFDPADYNYGHELIAAIQTSSPDIVFIGLHGGEGENGILQAMLSGNNISYTGSGFKTSAVAMDKLLSKFVARQSGTPVPEFAILDKAELQAGKYSKFSIYLETLSQHRSTGKMVVKPVDAGSSVGVHIISTEDKWDEALQDAFLYSDKVMLEEYIEGRELTVTILDGNALPVVEITPHEDFYNYHNKYNKGKTDYQAPADLTTTESEQVQHYALQVWQAMECSGYARIDFRYDGKDFYFLEVNTLPGMTPLSLTPMAAKAVGINFGELLDAIIQAALPALKKYK